MKHNVLTAMVVTAGVLLLVASTTLAVPYYVTDLGTLGGAWSRPNGINSAGEVVGEAIDASGNRLGFAWTTAGGMQSIGSLGGNDSVAYDVNDSGTIVGGSYNASGYWHAFQLPSGGSMTDLGTLTGGVYSNAYAINNAGQITGAADYYVSNPGKQYTAVKWAAGGTGMTDIGTLGGVLSWGYAINSSGQIAGAATNGSNYTHGFRYTTSETDMGVLSLYSEMHGINDAGTVVGIADTSGGYTNAVYRTATGSLTAMGLLSGSTGNFSEARAINNNNVIVGRSEVSDGTFHGFMETIGGTMVDLNSIPEVAAAGKTIYDALAINDNGQIAVDFGPPGDTERAGLLTPALAGDANMDKKVSFADYLILEQNFGKTGMTWAQADFNGDGKVSFADYLLLEANFGKSLVNTPEPASLALIACGALALIRRKR